MISLIIPGFDFVDCWLLEAWVPLSWVHKILPTESISRSDSCNSCKKKITQWNTSLAHLIRLRNLLPYLKNEDDNFFDVYTKARITENHHNFSARLSQNIDIAFHH